MLKSLIIRDYALIESITVTFENGLNIITGETGAGKSILLGALGLLLGDRASIDSIRRGAEKAIVEGIFLVHDSPSVDSFLTAHDLDIRVELIVRREIVRKGNSRCFVNDTPVPLQLLKDMGDLLLDLHGQHEHQSLLRPETHIGFLDEYGGYDELLTAYSELFRRFRSLEKEIDELREKEQSVREKRSFFQFQLKEIEHVSPELGEDDRLKDELRVLENSENLVSLSEAVYTALYESEHSVYDRLHSLKQNVSELASIDPSCKEIEAEYKNLLIQFGEITDFFSRYRSRVEADPVHLETYRSRLSQLQSFKKKYNGTLEDILRYKETIEAELLKADNYGFEIERREKELASAITLLTEKAEILSAARSKAAETLSREIETVMKELGFSHAEFLCKIRKDGADEFNGTKKKFHRLGIDAVEFFISANKGEDTKPLAKTASGGEVSRVMLALKSVLAQKDRYPVLLFDEIDTGISGRIAMRAAAALKKLSARHQVIAITHLPQIAAAADFHFVVEKETRTDRSVSFIKRLTESESEEETAKLISGEAVTDAALQSARVLKEQIRSLQG